MVYLRILLISVLINQIFIFITYLGLDYWHLGYWVTWAITQTLGFLQSTIFYIAGKRKSNAVHN